MAEYLTTDTDLESVADAIRAKGGTIAPLEYPDGFVSAIQAIPTGGGGDHDAEDGMIDDTLSVYSNSRVSEVCSYAFYRRLALTDVSFPECETIGSYGFYGCTSLSRADFPKCKSIGASAFRSCALLEVDFQECQTIGETAFSACNNMSIAKFSSLTAIMSNAFNGCRQLLSLYIYGSSIPTLANSNAFTNTPIGGSSYSGKYGKIYVPASLISSYIAAQNWSRLSTYFSAVDG